MNDKQMAKNIMKMDAMRLLDFVMASPEYLTDSYYSTMGIAIRTRYKELTA